MANSALDAFAIALMRAEQEDRTPARTGPRSPSQNTPYQPEQRRMPRSGDPAKWSPPPYRDRDAERIAGRLSRKEK